MGAKLSTKRTSLPKRGARTSIFELLLQLPKVEITNDNRSGLEEWMQELFMTHVDDVSYEVVETYFRNFVFFNLLQANLVNGNIYHYWELYITSLEHILERDAIPEEDHDLEGDQGSTSAVSLEGSGETGSNDRYSSSEMHFDAAKGSYTAPLLKARPGPLVGTNEDKGCDNSAEEKQRHARRVSGPKEFIRSTSMRLRGRRQSVKSNVTSELEHVDPNDTFAGIYEDIRRGKGDIAQRLTPFVISKIFMKCLMEYVNAVELLFHMDYLPYYLEWTSKATLKLKAEDGIHLVNEKKTKHTNTKETNEQKQQSRSMDVKKDIDNGKQQTTDLDTRSTYEKFTGCCSTENGDYDNNRTLKLRCATESTVIIANIAEKASLRSMDDAILYAAIDRWSDSTIRALHRGYCFIDHKMRIFSLKSMGKLLNNTSGMLEFMVIPFCTVGYGGSKVKSRLQNLIVALFKYTTAHIKPASTGHDTFIKATQSMTADVLTILMSSIVMTPYLCVFTPSNGPGELPAPFAWISRVSKRTKSVAPYYYIHMECLRTQILEDFPSPVDYTELQPVFDYYDKKNAPMAYNMVESTRLAVGDMGLRAIVKSLIRLFLTTAPNSGCKRHITNLRNHMTLLFLLLIRAKERDKVLYYNEQGDLENMYDSTDTLLEMQEYQVDIPLDEVGLPNTQGIRKKYASLTNINYATHLGDCVSPILTASLAKAMHTVSAPKLCSNELWLILIDLLLNNVSFKYTFFDKSSSFIKELMNTIKNFSTVTKESCKVDHDNKSKIKPRPMLTSMTPLVRTLISILTQYVIHQKVTSVQQEAIVLQQNYLDECKIDLDKMANMLISVLDWNFQTQKDTQLTHAVYSLVNEVVAMPVILSRATADKLLKTMCNWITIARVAINKANDSGNVVSASTKEAQMILEMIGAGLNFVKAGLSPETLVKNLNLMQAVLDNCTTDQLEDLCFDIKGSNIDTRSLADAAESHYTMEMMDVEAMKNHALRLLDFLALIIRTFMGYKIHAMYELESTKATFGHHSVTLVVSNLIREINEETRNTKSALALAICRPNDIVEPPITTPKEGMHYHMSQIWIAAYRSQHQSTLWLYRPDKN
ncbi:serine threonine kinase TIO, putative [Babesia ovis]|uniref:Serine threonine kinase TIO, putative n=1 Tax=Babesia ovis TaxID=5869 RepID=A0A9W5TEN8_BABOV|nr:serine threonine kinase TIO, putative [Babesia ovis]